MRFLKNTRGHGPSKGKMPVLPPNVFTNIPRQASPDQKPIPVVAISSSISALPVYAFYSIVRMAIAYMLSLAFAVSYGYIAAYNPRVEPWMVAVLDILQSIPVLSFLPPVVLAMVSLIPGHQLGIEMGVILLIFTGQVWNLAFSFYSSLKSIPREMIEASRIYRFSGWQRFWQLEMPYSAIGLVWNSIVSVAGGWFALIFCESFTMGNRNFQLPGLGSYIQTATNNGDVRALLAGIATVIVIVVATDQLVWRPLIAWSDKFKFEQVESAEQVKSPILEVLRRSKLWQSLPGRIWSRVEEPVYEHLARSKECRVIKPLDANKSSKVSPALWTLAAAVLMAGCWAAAQTIFMLRTITWPDLRLLLEGAAATFLRVNAALLISAAWTIPVGVAIGLNPRLARVVQPLAQIMASVPATAVFPILLIGLVKIGGGLGIGSIALMLLGTQWYILFNVIAGAMSIPSDLREVASLYRFTRWQRWTQTHSSRHLPLPDHRHGYGLGRRVERLRHGRVLARERPDAADHRPGRADRRRHRQRAFRHAAAGHHPHLAHGRHHEPAGVAQALPAGRNAV